MPLFTSTLTTLSAPSSRRQTQQGHELIQLATLQSTGKQINKAKQKRGGGLQLPVKLRYSLLKLGTAEQLL